MNKNELAMALYCNVTHLLRLVLLCVHTAPRSQPSPPDTPEHASALLLFLAAALRRVEQECHPEPDFFLQWLPDDQDLAAERHLLDLCLCLDPQQSLQLLLQQAVAAAQVADTTTTTTTSISSSSSSSRGGAVLTHGSSSCGRGETIGGRVSSQNATEGDGVFGNVVAAALQLAVELNDLGSAPAAGIHNPNSNGSSSSSTGGSCSGGVPSELQQQQQQAGVVDKGADAAAAAAAAAGDGGGGGGGGDGSQSLKLQRLLQMLRPSLLPQQQQQQQQQQEHAQHGSGHEAVQQQKQQPQQQASGSPSVTDVAALIAKLVHDCIEQQMSPFTAAAAKCDTAEGDQPAAGAAPAAAADAAPEGDVDSSCAAAAAAQQQSTVANGGAAETAASCECSNSPDAAADAAAWNIAVIIGALALSRLFPGPARSEFSSGGPHCPVQAALLFTAIEGLYFGVREDLQQFSSVKDAICDCRLCRNGTGPESYTTKRHLAMQRNQTLCKTDITSKVCWLDGCMSVVNRVLDTAVVANFDQQ